MAWPGLALWTGGSVVIRKIQPQVRAHTTALHVTNRTRSNAVLNRRSANANCTGTTDVGPALFWAVTQPVPVNPYRRLGNDLSVPKRR